MGIYYTNIVYYGRILTGKTYRELLKLQNISKNIDTYKINNDRYLLYHKNKFAYCDDNINDIKTIPDYIEKDNLDLYSINDDIFFSKDLFFMLDEEDIYNELVYIINNINPNANKVIPDFYVCCIRYDTYDSNSEKHVMYNILIK